MFPCTEIVISKESRSRNPLEHWTDEELQTHVKDFIESKGLEDFIPVKLYKTAARLAKDPMSYTRLKRKDQRDALEIERNSRWQQSKALYATIAVCSVAAMVQYVYLMECSWITVANSEKGVGIRLVR